MRTTAIGEQDASVLGLALERGRALLIAVNKWDGIPMEQRDEIRRQLALQARFRAVRADAFHLGAPRHRRRRAGARPAIRAYDAAMREMPTPQLTRVLEKALEAHQPPLVRGRRIKLRYAHQGGRNPPRIIIHGNQTDAVPDSYRRYLANVFREAFDLFATPVASDRTDAILRADPRSASRSRPKGGLARARQARKAPKA